MTTWNCKSVGDGVEAFEPSQRLHEMFFAVEKATGVTPGMAVFSHYDLRENIVRWYFSPQASVLASAFGALPCDKPVPVRGFSLSVGNANSWEIHFPGYLSSQRRDEF